MFDKKFMVSLSEEDINTLIFKLNRNRIAESRSKKNSAAILKKGSVGEQINQIIIIVFAFEGDLDRADWVSNSVIVSLSRTSLMMLLVSMQRRDRALTLMVGDIEVTAVKAPEVKPTKIMRSLIVQNEIHTLH